MGTKRLITILGVLCGVAVVALSLSAYLRSIAMMGEEAAVYDFDGRRYVLDSDVPDVPYLDLPPFDDLSAAVAEVSSLVEVASLGSVPVPGVLLAETGRGIIPLIVVDMDRTFVKAYEPRVGLVIFRRRVLETEYVGLAAPFDADLE